MLWCPQGAGRGGMDKGYYAILGVPRSADQAAIRAAYRRQMALYHPDKVAALGIELQKVAGERTKEINAAYDVLGDPVSRAAYDHQDQVSEPDFQRTPSPPPSSPQPRPEASRSPPPPPAPRKKMGPIMNGIQIFGGGVLALLAGATLANYASGIPNAAVSACIGVGINASLLAIYGGLYGIIHGVMAAMRYVGERFFLGKLAERLVKGALTAVSSVFLLIGLMVLVALRDQDTGDRFFYWRVMGALAFTAFTMLLLAKSVAPRRVDRLISDLHALLPLVRWKQGT